MLRTLQAAFAVIILATWLAAGANAEALNATQWHFSANFPCQSQVSGQTADSAVGRIVITFYACGDDSHSYFVAINDYAAGTIKPENRDNAYAGAVNGIATQIKGSIRNTTVYTLANIDGREAFVDIPENKGALRSRLFLVGDRLYQTACIGNAGSENGNECVAFLNSFTLIAIDPLLKSNSPPSK